MLPKLDQSQQGIFIVSHRLIVAITRFKMLDRGYSLVLVDGTRTCHSPFAGILHYDERPLSLRLRTNPERAIE